MIELLPALRRCHNAVIGKLSNRSDLLDAVLNVATGW